MVARLTDRMEEMAARPADGNASISAHVLVRHKVGRIRLSGCS
jgi:hypothetical protein